MLSHGLARQNFGFDTAPVKALVATLPADQKTITVGCDSLSSDHQLVANLFSAQFAHAILAVIAHECEKCSDKPLCPTKPGKRLSSAYVTTPGWSPKQMRSKFVPC